VTGKPELELATMVKLLPSIAVAGAAVVTVIVWLAWLMVSVTEPELAPWLLSPE
jgi:preprotein translocase subunit SecY